MAEGHHSPSTTDPPNEMKSTILNETKSNNKKNDSLYVKPTPKCYIGIGNNPEL
jgi:hypothetical protein